MLVALGFLTPLPVGGGRAPTGRTLLWFPLAGALLGGLLGLVWRILDRVVGGQGIVVAALLIACDLALTGALHFDGLVDSADGLFAPVGRARRLEIMSGPEVGAFGVAAGVVGLLLRFAVLAPINRPQPLLLVALWCASRTAMAAVATSLPYARAEGLAAAFLEGGTPHPTVIAAAGAALALFAGALWDPARGPLAVAAGLVASLGVAALARRRIGGFTGDVLGACGFVCETVGLLVVAAG